MNFAYMTFCFYALIYLRKYMTCLAYMMTLLLLLIGFEISCFSNRRAVSNE